AEVDALSKRIPTEIARHVIEDNEREFHEYVRTTGAKPLIAALAPLFPNPDESDSSFVTTERTVDPPRVRIITALRDVYGAKSTYKYHDAYRRRPLPERKRILKLVSEVRRADLGSTVPLDVKEQRLRQLIAATAPFEAEIDVADLYAFYAEILPRVE